MAVPRPGPLGRPRREELLVGIAGCAGVLGDDHLGAAHVDRLDAVGELVVDDQDARRAVAHDVLDLRRAEARVDGDEDGAGRGHAVVRLEDRGHVRAQDGHAVAALDAFGLQAGREPTDALRELAVRAAHVAVHDGGPLRHDLGGVVQEVERAQLDPEGAGVHLFPHVAVA